MKSHPWNKISLNAMWGQVKVLTLANLKSRYRKTIAGFLWVVLNPLLMYFVQSQVFTRILKIPTTHYFLYLASGLLPWIFISQSMDMGTPLFINYSPLLKAFPANPMVYLTAQMLDNFINFLAAFLLILVPLCFYYQTPLVGLALLPIPLAIMCAGITGLTWILATTQVFFRDTRFLVSFAMGVSFFLTPVFYPIEAVPENMRWLININPFYIFIAPFRVCIYDFDFNQFVLKDLHALATAAFMIGFATLLWRKKKNEVYFYL